MAVTPYSAFSAPIVGYVAADPCLNVHTGPASTAVTCTVALGQQVTATGAMTIDGRTWVQLSDPPAAKGGWVISQDAPKGKPVKVWVVTTPPTPGPPGTQPNAPDDAVPVGWLAAVGVALTGFVAYQLTRRKKRG